MVSKVLGGRRTWIVGGVVLALVAAAAVVGGIWWAHRGPDYPDHWDPRVLPLVKYVERERGLDFEHPVYVDFLSPADFAAQVTRKAGDLTDEDRKQLRESEGVLRALGLIGPKVDLLKETNDLQAGGILGLYDLHDKRIRVRGTKLTLDVRSTLVHELTHVLQDQQFDLAARSDRLDKDDDTEAATAWRAMAEGDADRIEQTWDLHLPPKRRKELARLQARTEHGADKAIAKVPPFLKTDLQSPYTLGGAFLYLAYSQGGNDAIDDAFSRPPTDTEQLLDPWVYLADHQGPVDVPKPAIGAHDEELDSQTFGAADLAFVLAERIQPAEALRAADGWGGDSTVAYTHHDRTCLRMDYVGDTRRDTEELSSALKEWIAAGPSDVATVVPHEKGLRFTTCDPGARFRPGTGGSNALLQLSAARTYLAAHLVKEHAPTDFIRCYTSRIIDLLGVRVLRAENAGDKAAFEGLAEMCKQ